MKGIDPLTLLVLLDLLKISSDQWKHFMVADVNYLICISAQRGVR